MVAESLDRSLRQRDDAPAERYDPKNLYLNNVGTFWYYNKDGNVVELDEAADEERERQNFDPASEPATGHPRYPRMISQFEIPASRKGRDEEDEGEGQAQQTTEPQPSEPQTQVEKPQAPKLRVRVRSRPDTDGSYKPRLADDSQQTTPEAQTVAADAQSEAQKEHAEFVEMIRKLDPNKFRENVMRRGTFTHPDAPRDPKTNEPLVEFEQADIDWIKNGAPLDQLAERGLEFQEQNERQPQAGDQTEVTPESLGATQRGDPNRFGYYQLPDGSRLSGAQMQQLIQQTIAAQAGGNVPQGPGNAPPGAPPQGPANAPRGRQWHPTGPLVAPLVQPRQFRPSIPNAIRRQLSNDPLLARSVVFEEPPTMDVILANPQKQEMFGRLVAMRGRADLVSKYENSRTNPQAMSEDDWNALQGLRTEFQQRSALLEEFRTNVESGDVAFILRNNPGFSFLRNSFTPAKAETLIKQYMGGVFMESSNSEINQMISAQRANTDIRRSYYYNELKERTQKATGVSGLNPDEIKWSGVDKRTRNQILNPHHVYNIFAVFSRQSARLSADLIKSIKQNNMNTSRILAASLSRNPELLTQVVEAAHNNETVPGLTQSAPTTFADTTTQANIMRERMTNAQPLRDRIRNAEFRTAVEQRTGRTWANMTRTERETGSFEQLRQENLLPQQPRGQGWFALLLGAFFNAISPRTRQELAPEFAA